MKDFHSVNRNARNSASAGVFKARETGAQLVRSELAAASAANDAKTKRLRALRLEKERMDAEAAAMLPAAPIKLKKAPARRTVG